MAECSNSIQKRGSSNPIQSKIVENDHGSTGASSGDNTIEDITCDASVAIGDIVRLSGSTIVKAQANNFTNSKAIGICTSKASTTVCNVQVTGFTTTVFSGLTSGTLYFLSDSVAGQLTAIPPTTSGSYVIRIGAAFESNKIIMQIQRIVKRA